jgi:hypothetical protein
MMGKDILEDYIARLEAQLAAAAPDLPIEALMRSARQIELDVRRARGGSEHYLKKAPAEGKAFSLGNALAAGVPLAQAFAEVGVKRAMGYRLIARRWRKSA